MKKRMVNAGFFLFLLLLVGTLSGCSFGKSDPTGPEETQSGNSGADGVLSFSLKSGFYKKDISLEILCDNEEAEIYYTFDGSEPGESDFHYTQPIVLKNRSGGQNKLSNKTGVCASGDYEPDKVDKANVIRAVAFFPDGTKSNVINGTYFVGIDRQKKYGKVPIISLFTDPENLFNYETGIYVLGKTYKDWLAEDPAHASYQKWNHVGNYSMKGREWERPVTVEYLAPDGTSAFVQDMGLRISGGASRDSVQKSFRITARDEYGAKSVKYELIPDNLRSDGTGNVEKYKSFLLRNGGNDRDSAKIRDAFLQERVSDRRFETQQYTPCVVYLDGEYWGWYLLNEDYGDHYIENNYGIDNHDVIVVKRGEIEDGNDEDIELFNEMFDFITKNDMSDEANYKKAAEMLDMGSFADFCALQLYVFNEDSVFENNNWEMWRVRNADGATPVSDGKWRMMVYDMDYSCGVYAGGNNYNTNNIAEVLQGKRKPSVFGDESKRRGGELFAALYKSQTFRRELVLAMCDLRNLNFEKTASIRRLGEISDTTTKLSADQFRRFGPMWANFGNPEGYYDQKVNEISLFLSKRYDIFPGLMKSSMSLNKAAACNISVKKNGAVRINSSEIDITGDFEGIYFTDYDITLTAVPAEGAKFVRWECENCTVSDEKAEKITVSFQGDFKVKAIFE